MREEDVNEMKAKLDDLQEKLNHLDSIEDRMIRMGNRESREIQYNIILYSSTMGAIIGASLSLLTELIKMLFPQQYEGFIIFAIYGFTILFAIILAKSKDILELGDYELRGTMEIKEKQKIKFLEDLDLAISSENVSLEKRIKPSFYGLSKLGYWYHAGLNTNLIHKKKYLSANLSQLRSISLLYHLENERGYSEIYLDFERKKFIVSLSENHFTYRQAKAILPRIKIMFKAYTPVSEPGVRIESERGF
jgi:hypothetical protein